MAQYYAYVYRLWDEAGRLLYVGMSGKSAHRRIGQHLAGAWWGETIARATIVRYWTRQQALAAEARAIRTEYPRWNINGAQGTTFAERDHWTMEQWRDTLLNLHYARDKPGTKRGHYPGMKAEFEQRYGRKFRTDHERRKLNPFKPSEMIEIPGITVAELLGDLLP